MNGKNVKIVEIKHKSGFKGHKKKVFIYTCNRKCGE